MQVDVFMLGAVTLPSFQMLSTTNCISLGTPSVCFPCMLHIIHDLKEQAGCQPLTTAKLSTIIAKLSQKPLQKCEEKANSSLLKVAKAAESPRISSVW